jgi:hypothetical protein
VAAVQWKNVRIHTIFKDTLHHHRKNIGEWRKENTAFFRATAVGGYLEDRSGLWGWGE